jgi:proteic killer suppression protein
MAIKSFKSQDILNFYVNGIVPKGASWHNVSKVALRKLDMLDAAFILSDLNAPPSNKLESLKGDLYGYYSIRVNDQYRIIFAFRNNHAYEVDIVDYHF